MFQWTGNEDKKNLSNKLFNIVDFKKIHEAQFKKMLSIDEYIERKNKMCNFSNSVNEIKVSDLSPTPDIWRLEWNYSMSLIQSYLKEHVYRCL